MGRFFQILALALVATVSACVIAGCSAERGTPVSQPRASENVSQDETRAAQAVLEGLFVAWASKDASAVEEYVRPELGGGDWEFEKVDRVEFGAIASSPKDVPGYISNGLGSVSGVKASDVRVFRASITLYYKDGEAGVLQDGQPNDYMWFLEKLPSGKWQVTDWGY